MEVWRKNLTILWGTQFLAMVGMNLVVPFLPFFIRQLGVEDPTDLAHWSGLVFSGPFILSFFATPLWGSLGPCRRPCPRVRVPSWPPSPAGGGSHEQRHAR